MILKFILIVGVVSGTTGEVKYEVPAQSEWDTMEECVAAGDAHFADRPTLQGAYFMCGELANPRPVN